MKVLTLFGIILLALGGFILVRGFSYSSDRSVLKVGEFQASLEEKHPVPAWAGALAIVGGIVLVIAGSRRQG
jgi:hypothetical protein